MENLTINNHNNKLLSLHDEILCLTLAYSIDTTKSLKEIIRPALLLKTTCKNFNLNQLPITIGKVCKCYPIEEKNTVMKLLLEQTNSLNYDSKRNALLLLAYAGANNNAYKHHPLLLQAIDYNDPQMIAVLFENGTKPDQKKYSQILSQSTPIFFDIRTVSIAKMFAEKGLNLNSQSDNLEKPNVLSACIIGGRSLELFKFYLDHNVDAKQKNRWGSCLLHDLALNFSHFDNVNDCVQIATLLLKAAPDIINTLNLFDKTPLDTAKEKLENSKQHDYNSNLTLFELLQNKNYNSTIALIEFLKNHDGKTAEELKQGSSKQ
jgi:hypothetical protein